MFVPGANGRLPAREGRIGLKVPLENRNGRCKYELNIVVGELQRQGFESKNSRQRIHLMIRIRRRKGARPQFGRNGRLPPAQRFVNLLHQSDSLVHWQILSKVEFPGDGSRDLVEFEF